MRQLVRGNIGELTWTPDSQGITTTTLEEGGGSIVATLVAGVVVVWLVFGVIFRRRR